MRNCLSGRVSFYSSEAENLIADVARYGDFNFVWFDSADCFGPTVMKIKHQCPKLPVYVFWHTVPYPVSFADIFNDTGFSRHTVTAAWNNRNINSSRRLCSKYADSCIVLNDRDAFTFRELYGKAPELLLQMCLDDNADILAEEGTTQEDFIILFVGGGLHMPNVDGIKWFSANVMPHLNKRAVLYIVGNAMDNWKDAPEFAGNDRIRIVGRTDNLNPFYNKADLAVVPIFYGPGMMTKVAEALMHGKNVLASGHALNGYPDLEKSSRCDTAEEFINRINGMITSGTKRFNPAMRKLYEDKYSLDAMEKVLCGFFKEKGVVKNS